MNLRERLEALAGALDVPTLECGVSDGVDGLKQDAADIREALRLLSEPAYWQVCPVCGGKGIVQTGFYLAPITTPSYSTSSCSPEKCRRCDGLGTIVQPTAGAWEGAGNG